MHRAFAGLAALAVVVPVVLTGVAPAAAQPVDRRASRVEAHRWLAQQRRGLAADRLGGAKIFGLPQPGRRPAATAGSFNFASATLTDAGRLGGRAHPAVLDERQFASRTAGRYGLTARNGRTGKALWSKTVRLGLNGLAIVTATPEPVGPDGALGVVLLELSAVPGAGTDTKVTTTLTALSGADGSQLWRTSVMGTQSVSGALTDVPGPVELFHDRAGVMDYLVDLGTTTDTGNTTIAERISGADGSTAQFGPAYSTATDFPAVSAVDDLDGDRLADVVVVSPGSGAFVRGVSGVTAATLWTTDVPSDVEPLVSSIGHYSDPAVNDIAIEAFGSDSSFSALAGRTGQLLWTRPADGIAQIAAAGSPLVPALDVYRLHRRLTTTSMRATAVVKAITPTGRVVYQPRVHVSVHQVRHATSSGAGVSLAARGGDVQPDGAIESRLDVSASSSRGRLAHRVDVTGIVDGRTGAFHRFPPAEPADGSLVHGRGTDYLHLKTRHGRATLSAWNGTSRRLLYRRTIGAAAHMTDGSATGLRVSGHACSDIALTAANRTQGLVALLSARGARRWTVAYPVKFVTGGFRHDRGGPPRDCV